MMVKTSIWQRIAAVVCLAMLLTACGQKGDLYLPEGSVLINWIA